jgi:hypothetical protein
MHRHLRGQRPPRKLASADALRRTATLADTDCTAKVLQPVRRPARGLLDTPCSIGLFRTPAFPAIACCEPHSRWDGQKKAAPVKGPHRLASPQRAWSPLFQCDRRTALAAANAIIAVCRIRTTAASVCLHNCSYPNTPHHTHRAAPRHDTTVRPVVEGPASVPPPPRFDRSPRTTAPARTAPASTGDAPGIWRTAGNALTCAAPCAPRPS